MISRGNFRCPSLRDQRGGASLGSIVLVGAAIAVIVFVDWDTMLEKLSMGSSGPIRTALTQLSCHAETNGIDTYVQTTGSIENIGDEPLRLSVRVDYAANGRIFAGRRTITPVRPAELSPSRKGSFSLREHVELPPQLLDEVGCLIELYENDVHEPIRFEDRT